MANLREYSAPQSLGLNPTETGIDAITAAARRTEGFYNQKAEALSQEGHIAAASIQAIGDIAVKQVDHSQISAGAVSFAKLQDNLTQQWNEVAKNSDPNDPSVA